MRITLRLRPEQLLASLKDITDDMGLPPPCEGTWLQPEARGTGLVCRVIAYSLSGLWGPVVLRHELVHRPVGGTTPGECDFKHETLSLWRDGRLEWRTDVHPSGAWWGSMLIRSLAQRVSPESGDPS